MNNPSVSIIILNWNGWDDTIECLESLCQIDYHNYNIIVVDNNSTDNSINNIKKYCEGNLRVTSSYFKYNYDNKPINIFEFNKKELETTKILDKYFDLHSNRKLILIKNDKNYGFAEGNNIGIKYAYKHLDPDYIFLLNNDTVVDKSFLTNLVKLGESNKKIKVIGPKLYHYNPDEKHDIIQSTGGKVTLTKYPGYYPFNCNVIDKEKNINHYNNYDWVSGAAMMLKVKDNLLLLNTDFFFGCEDIDLCIKLNKKGYKIAVSLESKIWHKNGKSRGKKYHNMDKKLLDILKGRTTIVKTNLKLLKIHNPYFYLLLPTYTLKIAMEYMYDILQKYKHI